jgi:hypothetical protein
VRKTFGHLTRAETRRGDARRVQRIQQLRQSIDHPAILCREVRRTIRLYIDAQRNFQHCDGQLTGGRLQQIRRSIAVLLLLSATQLRAQSAATVPSSSGVYDKLESVGALFPTRGVFNGERPLSRQELLRVVRELTRAIDSAGATRSSAWKEWARRELAAVSEALSREPDLGIASRAHASGAWRVAQFSSDASSQRIESNGLGSIDAVAHPFAPRSQGWPTGQGSVATFAPTAAVGWRHRLAVLIEPRATVGHFRDGARDEDISLHRAFARGVWHNVALQVGADELRWGQSSHGALFISGHASPLPAISVGTDTSITLPWLFRHAGSVRFTGFVADLGPSQVPRHTKLAGWQASLQRWSRFELGVAVLAQQGGEGGPKASLLERVVDLLPIIDALAPQHADLQFSNKLAGGNLRLRFPELSGLDFYYELQIDDFDGRRLRSSFVDDAGHLLGARLPLVLGGGQLSWRAEWHRTSLRLYQHSQFVSGVTLRERLIGNSLGPNAGGGYLSAAWESSPLSMVELWLGHESRDPSQFTVTTAGSRDRGFKFVRLTNDPRYKRNRAELAVDRVGKLGAIRLRLGYNRAWRSGQPANNEWLGSLLLRSQHLSVF